MLELVEALLAERLDGGHPWAVDLLRDGARGTDTVVLRTWHPFVDGRGAERLLRWLGSGEGDAPPAPAPFAERYAISERPLAALDRKARLELMRRYTQHSMELGRVPVLSLASAQARQPSQAGGLVPGRTRVLRVELSADETRAFDQPCARSPEGRALVRGSEIVNFSYPPGGPARWCRRHAAQPVVPLRHPSVATGAQRRPRHLGPRRSRVALLVDGGRSEGR